jgi:GAF domain-containing protein
MQEGRGLIVQDADRQSRMFLHLRHAVPVTQAMAVPLIGESGARGALVAGRLGRHSTFTAADLEMAETFAGQATIALELADARAGQQYLAALEDRDRIARDLHDHVVQRLFAVGLGLQSTAAQANESAIRARLTQAVEELGRLSDRSAVRSSTSMRRCPTTGSAAASRRSSMTSNQFLGFSSSSRGLDRSTHSWTRVLSPMSRLSFGKP